MIAYTSTVEIRRPTHEVFAMLLDGARFQEWTPMVGWRWLTPGEPRVGSRAEFRMTDGPISGTLTAEVVELVPDRRVGFAIEHPAVSWRAVSNLEPTPEGTRLEYGGEIRMHGWRRLLEPLMAREVRAGEAKEVERLRDVLEARAGAAEDALAPA